MNKNTLLIQCADQKGLIAKISKVLFEAQFNIIEMKEHVDEETQTFYMRCEFLGDVDSQLLNQQLTPVLPVRASIKINPAHKKKIVVLATKEHHCLSDLLIRHYFDELNAEIQCVIANHEDLREIVGKFGLPYHYVSHHDKDKRTFENELRQVISSYEAEYLVLAKFMRVLSPEFVGYFRHKIVNIHHSFLPAFVGANPYRQAFERGIKLIGATAHFVTDELDQGPIITQKTIQVDHSYSANDMKTSGREIERLVLAEALKSVFEDRIFITGNKTIVFD